MGANANLTAFDAPWEDARLIASVRDLGLRHIRYPAGTLGNYWDWDEGWVDAGVPDSLMIPWVVRQGLKDAPRRYTLDNLALVHEATGVTPVYMLNMLSKDLEHGLRGLRRARDLGMPVEYVELGNELYFDLPFPKLVYPTPEDYGRACAEWMAAVRAEFPGARVAVVGNYLERHDRQRGWTQRVLGECPGADAVTYHKYTPIGLDGRLARRNLAPGREGLGNPYTATRHYGGEDEDGRAAWELGLLRDEGALANALAGAQHGGEGWDELGAPAGTEVWATEFNVRDDASAVRGTWAQTLVLAQYYSTFLDGPVAVVTIHNLVGELFGLLDTEVRLDAEARADAPYPLTAAGVATAVFARASDGADAVTVLEYPDAGALADDRGEEVPRVRAFRFASGEAVTGGLYVNFGYEPLTVALPPGLGGLAAVTYSAPLEQRIGGWPDVDQTVTLPPGDRLTLPPHSITRLRPRD